MVPNDVLTDSGDVKYRVGRLKKPLEGKDAKNGVLFKVATRHPRQDRQRRSGHSTMCCSHGLA